MKRWIVEGICKMRTTTYLLGSTVVKNPPANAGNSRDAGLIPRLETSSWEGNGNPSSILAWKRGAWWATVHEVDKSQIQLCDWARTYLWGLVMTKWWNFCKVFYRVSSSIHSSFLSPLSSLFIFSPKEEKKSMTKSISCADLLPQLFHNRLHSHLPSLPGAGAPLTPGTLSSACDGILKIPSAFFLVSDDVLLLFKDNILRWVVSFHFQFSHHMSSP